MKFQQIPNELLKLGEEDAANIMLQNMADRGMAK